MSSSSAAPKTSSNGTNGHHGPPRVPKGSPTSHLTANAEREEKHLQTLTKLRELSLDSELKLDLPQILVSGSQSAGKSSVLEALTTIPFPSNEDTCTRFVTEVTLKHATTESWKFTLEFGAGTTPSRAWERECRDRKDIASLFEEASSVLFSTGFSGFSKSILHVEAFSPVLRPLQILDLPGLILNDPDDHNNVDLVRNIVLRYIQDPNSTILAVISATQDLKEHEILSISKDHDSGGLRTLAVITKPDLATQSKADHLVSVVRGEAPDSSKYNHKWHILRNRTENERRLSWDERNVVEEKFFSTEAPWNRIPVDKRGISSLIERLRKILFRQDILGQMEDSIQRSLKESKAKLSALDDANPTMDDHRSTYATCAETLRRLARDHARAKYEFDVNHKDPKDNLLLRSRIHEKNEKFRDQMLVNGHKWESGFFASEPSRYASESALPSRDTKPLVATSKTFAEFVAKDEKDEIEWVKGLMKDMGGNFLPLDPNPDRISNIFWTISCNWKVLATQHLNEVHQVCKKYYEAGTPHAFAEAAIEQNAVSNDTPLFLSSKISTVSTTRVFGFPNSTDVASRLVRDHVFKRLNKVAENATKELERLDKDRKRRINIYNPSFVTFRKDYENGNKFSQSIRTRRAAPQFVGEINAEALANNAKDQTTETAEGYLAVAWMYYGVSYLPCCRNNIALK